MPDAHQGCGVGCPGGGPYRFGTGWPARNPFWTNSTSHPMTGTSAQSSHQADARGRAAG
jgi:hypothetical protein